MLDRKYIITLFLLLSFWSIGSIKNTYAQVPINKEAEKASRKKAKSLEKQYKKALKHHKKIQTKGGNKRSKRVVRKARLARDNKKGLFANRTKGGSYRKGIRKVKTRGKLKTFKSNTRKGIGKVGKGIGRGFEKIGDGFRKIKLPKIKWPRVFKRK